MKIGILQAGHTPDEMLADYGNYGDLFTDLLDGQGFDFQIYDVVNMAFPGDVHACDGWLITGSRHGAYDDLPFIAPLERLIRDIYAADLPLVGICFGHQIIAQALGGTVEKFDGGWAVGRQSYTWDGHEVAMYAWHQDQVTALPDGAKAVASNGMCENAVVVYGQKAFTIQAHPEFDGNFVDGLATYRGRGRVPDDLLQQAKATRNDPVDNDRMARQIGAFFKERAIT